MTVFVVNKPLKWSEHHKRYTLAVDLRPAHKFGDLIFLTREGFEPVDGEESWLDEMEDILEAFDHQTDYLLPVGHPLCIVAAGALLGAHGHTFLRVLKWDRARKDYTPFEITLVTPPENQIKPATPKGD